MARWQTGLAKVVKVNGKVITVACPHCSEQHEHGRGMLGSRNAVAGCHTGFTRLREYRIPEQASAKFTEQVEPGAFRKSLKRSAVRAPA